MRGAPFQLSELLTAYSIALRTPWTGFDSREGASSPFGVMAAHVSLMEFVLHVVNLGSVVKCPLKGASPLIGVQSPFGSIHHKIYTQPSQLEKNFAFTQNYGGFKSPRLGHPVMTRIVVTDNPVMTRIVVTDNPDVKLP